MKKHLKELGNLELQKFKLRRSNLKNPEVKSLFKKKFFRHTVKVTVTCLSLVAVTTLSSATAAAVALDNTTIILNNEAGKRV
jgi:hypothetical protein